MRVGVKYEEADKIIKNKKDNIITKDFSHIHNLSSNTFGIRNVLLEKQVNILSGKP